MSTEVEQAPIKKVSTQEPARLAEHACLLNPTCLIAGLEAIRGFDV